MNIIQNNINWNGSLIPLNLKQVEGIALHHMDHPTWNFNDVHAFHRDTRGWLGIGYNYWIGFDGKIYEGRGLSQGAHVKGCNDKLIGIGFQGEYDGLNGSMPDAQFNAGVELIKWLKDQIPTARVVHGHNHWQSTACPGKHFPLVEMISLKKRGVEIVKEIELSDLKPTKIIDERSSQTIEAFIVNGVTYAPIRQIAEVSGRIVFWDGKNVILK